MKPEAAETFRDNLKSLSAKLDELRNDLQSIASDDAKPVILTSSPEFKYLTRRAGLEDVHFHWTNQHDKEGPPEIDWPAFDKRLADKPAKKMIWPSTPPAEIADKLKTRGVEVIVIDTLDREPEAGDYYSALSESIHRLKEALGQPDQ